MYQILYKGRVEQLTINKYVRRINNCMEPAYISINSKEILQLNFDGKVCKCSNRL